MIDWLIDWLPGVHGWVVQWLCHHLSTPNASQQSSLQTAALLRRLCSWSPLPWCSRRWIHSWPPRCRPSSSPRSPSWNGSHWARPVQLCQSNRPSSQGAGTSTQPEPRHQRFRQPRQGWSQSRAGDNGCRCRTTCTSWGALSRTDQGFQGTSRRWNCQTGPSLERSRSGGWRRRWSRPSAGEWWEIQGSGRPGCWTRGPMIADRSIGWKPPWSDLQHDDHHRRYSVTNFAVRSELVVNWNTSVPWYKEGEHLESLVNKLGKIVMTKSMFFSAPL